PTMSVLYGPPEDYGRYPVVKEFPYYHLDTYPEKADPSVIRDFLASEMAKPLETYRNQEIGDIDVGVFDRKRQTVHQIEVKTNQGDMSDARDEIDRFTAYSDALGWGVEAEIAVFYEKQRSAKDMVIQGRIDRYRY
ncbi:MAG: hypothetical protein SVS85_02270, partial [Candidatus Nanohaloarchaea archaeon]|nr:hypothetical protein [Candidatus Nanohaloarchaea archaeon]